MKLVIFTIFGLFCVKSAFCLIEAQPSFEPSAAVSATEKNEVQTARNLRLNRRIVARKMREAKLQEQIQDLIKEWSYEQPKKAEVLRSLPLKGQVRFLKENAVKGFFAKHWKKFVGAGAIGLGLVIPRLIQNSRLKRYEKEVNLLKPKLLESKEQKRADIAQIEQLVAKLEDKVVLLSGSTSQRITELSNFLDAHRVL